MGLSTCVMTGMAMGATLVLHHRFVPTKVLGLIESTQPTVFPGGARDVAALNQQHAKDASKAGLADVAFPAGRRWTRSSQRNSPRPCRCTVVEGYGLSEASPVTHAGPFDGTARPGHIGLPLPDTEGRIVDAETGQRNCRPAKSANWSSAGRK